MLSFFDTKSLEITKKINLNYIKVPSEKYQMSYCLEKFQN